MAIDRMRPRSPLLVLALIVLWCAVAEPSTPAPVDLADGGTVAGADLGLWVTRTHGFLREKESRLLDIRDGAEQNASAAREAKDECDSERYGFFLRQLQRVAEDLRRDVDLTPWPTPPAGMSRDEIDLLAWAVRSDSAWYRWIKGRTLEDVEERLHSRRLEFPDGAPPFVQSIEDMQRRFDEELASIRRLIREVEAAPAPCGGSKQDAVPEDLFQRPADAALAAANRNKGDDVPAKQADGGPKTFKGDIATLDESGQPTDGTVIEIPDDDDDDLRKLQGDDPIDLFKRYIVDATCQEREMTKS